MFLKSVVNYGRFTNDTNWCRISEPSTIGPQKKLDLVASVLGAPLPLTKKNKSHLTDDTLGRDVPLRLLNSARVGYAQ